MSGIHKAPIVSNYRNVSASKVKSTSKSTPVQNIYGKGEVHNNPDHRSGNDRYLIDTFYSNIHNLMASYNRLSDNPDSEEMASHYFRTHKNEVIKGAMDLVNTINDLIIESSLCDDRYGTHFGFLVESILHDFESNLESIGISYNNDQLILNRYTFLDELISRPNAFDFLFRKNTGLIDRLSAIHYKIEHISTRDDSQGQIIDYRT